MLTRHFFAGETAADSRIGQLAQEMGLYDVRINRDGLERGRVYGLDTQKFRRWSVRRCGVPVENLHADI